MTSRITAALSKFISPITSASAQGRSQSSTSQQASSHDFARFNPKRIEKEASDHQSPEQEAEPSLEQPSQDSPHSAHLRLVRSEGNTQPSSPLGLTSTFLQLLGLVRKNSHALKGSSGRNAYENARREQNKAGRFKKGAMVDEDIY